MVSERMRTLAYHTRLTSCRRSVLVSCRGPETYQNPTVPEQWHTNNQTPKGRKHVGVDEFTWKIACLSITINSEFIIGLQILHKFRNWYIHWCASIVWDRWGQDSSRAALTNTLYWKMGIPLLGRLNVAQISADRHPEAHHFSPAKALALLMTLGNYSQQPGDLRSNMENLIQIQADNLSGMLIIIGDIWKLLGVTMKPNQGWSLCQCGVCAYFPGHSTHCLWQENQQISTIQCKAHPHLM